MTVPTLNLRPRQNFSTGMNLTTAIIRKWESLPRLMGVFHRDERRQFWGFERKVSFGEVKPNLDEMMDTFY
jgi:hypothetical protein